MDYTENDAITTYMKHSLSDTHQLPYDHGKGFCKNVESEINNFPLSDRKFLFVDEQHIYELTTFRRVCFPIQDHPWPDLEFDVREVVRENRNPVSFQCFFHSQVNDKYITICRGKGEDDVLKKSSSS